MSEVIPDLSAPGLTKAIEANLAEEVESFGRNLPGGTIYQDAELSYFSTNRSFYNGVNLARFSSDDKAYIDARIAEMLAYFQALPFMWSIGPSTRPTNLAASLLAHGFTFSHDMEVLAIDLNTADIDIPSPEGLVIKEARDNQELLPLRTLEIICFDASEEIAQNYYDNYITAGFGIEKEWHHFIGWWHNQPVAMAALLLHAGVAGIYGVATIPEARKHGIGTALVQHAMREAYAAEHRVAILTPSEMSIKIYHRLGFQHWCTIHHYKWTPDK
jgi:GNAT superfamily N-acetyltransferase